MLICIALFIVLLLQTLDFSECVIEHIDRKAFGNLGNSIETISLKGNKLRSLQVWIKCCDLSCSQLQIVVFEITYSSWSFFPLTIAIVTKAKSCAMPCYRIITINLELWLRMQTHPLKSSPELHSAWEIQLAVTALSLNTCNLHRKSTYVLNYSVQI